MSSVMFGRSQTIGGSRVLFFRELWNQGRRVAGNVDTRGKAITAERRDKGRRIPI
jgi:hypothetical protein